MIEAKRAGVLSAALLISACGGVARVPEDSFYRLETAAPSLRTAAPELAGGLVVQGGAAAPLYRDRALLYSDADMPNRVQRYHYHYWADSPSRLVQRALADYLRMAGIAAPVTTADDGQDARHRLRIDIERFEHLRETGGGRVEVALRATVVERNRGIRLQETLQASAPVRGADFTAVVDAYEQALGDIYSRVAARLAALD